jgi:hypothetical protein
LDPACQQHDEISAEEKEKSGGSGTWIDGPLGFETSLVHAGVSPDAATGKSCDTSWQRAGWATPLVE